IGSDKTFAQLGQDHFERFAEAVEHANAAGEGDDGVARRSGARALVDNKGKLGLRVAGVYEEGRASIDVTLEQAHAFIGGAPGLHHDKVQLVAQEIVDYAFILIVHFEEIGEDADGSVSAAFHAVGLEQT